jgi:hypothetical protein
VRHLSYTIDTRAYITLFPRRTYYITDITQWPLERPIERSHLLLWPNNGPRCETMGCTCVLIQAYAKAPRGRAFGLFEILCHCWMRYRGACYMLYVWQFYLFLIDACVFSLISTQEIFYTILECSFPTMSHNMSVT